MIGVMKLYKVRKQKKLTLEKMSGITGISVSTLWRIENTIGYKVSLQDALRIVNHFPEVSLEDLNAKPMP